MSGKEMAANYAVAQAASSMSDANATGVRRFIVPSDHKGDTPPSYVYTGKKSQRPYGNPFLPKGTVMKPLGEDIGSFKNPMVVTVDPSGSGEIPIHIYAEGANGSWYAAYTISMDSVTHFLDDIKELLMVLWRKHSMVYDGILVNVITNWSGQSTMSLYGGLERMLPKCRVAAVWIQKCPKEEPTPTAAAAVAAVATVPVTYAASVAVTADG